MVEDGQTNWFLEELNQIFTDGDVDSCEMMIPAVRLNPCLGRAFLRSLGPKRGKMSDAEAWLLIRLLNNEADELQLTLRRTLMLSVRYESLTLPTLQRLLLRHDLWPPNSADNSILEFTRCLICGNFANSELNNFENQDSRVDSVFALWVQVLLPSLLSQPFPALRDRLLMQLISNLIPAHENNKRSTALSAQVLAQVSRNSPLLLEPHLDAVRRLLYEHAHHCSIDIVPMLCDLIIQISRVSHRAKQTCRLWTQTMLLSSSKLRCGYGCIMANYLMGSDLLSKNHRSIVTRAMRSLPSLWPSMTIQAQLLLLQSLTHCICSTTLDKELLTLMGQHFIIPILMPAAFVIVPSVTYEAFDDVRHIFSEHTLGLNSTDKIVLLENIGQITTTAEHGPSIILAISDYARAESFTINEIAAAAASRTPGDPRSTNRSYTPDKMLLMNQTLKVCLTFLSALLANSQYKFGIRIAFALPRDLLRLLSFDEGDDDASDFDLPLMSSASVLGCTICTSVLSLPFAILTKLAHTPAEWLRVLNVFERALSRCILRAHRLPCTHEQDVLDKEWRCQKGTSDIPPPTSTSPNAISRRTRPTRKERLASRSAYKQPLLAQADPLSAPERESGDESNIRYVKVKEEDIEREGGIPYQETNVATIVSEERRKLRLKRAVRWSRKRKAYRKAEVILLSSSSEDDEGEESYKAAASAQSDEQQAESTVWPVKPEIVKEERVLSNHEEPEQMVPKLAMKLGPNQFLLELYESLIPQLDFSTCLHLLQSIWHSPEYTHVTARLTSTILHMIHYADSPDGKQGWLDIKSKIVEADFIPFVLRYATSLSTDVMNLRMEISHLYRRESIYKRTSDAAGKLEIQNKTDIWKSKMSILGTLYQIMDRLFERIRNINESSSSTEPSVTALLSCCRGFFNAPQAQEAELLEMLYAYLVDLYKASQNFFLSVLLIKALLSLTSGCPKRYYVAFPIYRALTSVFPSVHFLLSFPRSPLSERLPEVTQAAISPFTQEASSTLPFCAYISYLLRSLHILPPAQYLLCTREIALALQDFVSTSRGLQYHHIFASMHCASLPTFVYTILKGVSHTSKRLMGINGSADVSTFKQTTIIECLALFHRIITIFGSLQHSDREKRVQLVLGASKLVLNTMEGCMRRLLSSSNTDFFPFLARLVSYGECLIEEVRSTLLLVPCKTTHRPASLRWTHLSEHMREFLNQVKSRYAKELNLELSEQKCTEWPDDEYSDNDEIDIDLDEDDDAVDRETDGVEDESTTSFPFTLHRGSDLYAEWEQRLWSSRCDADNPEDHEGTCRSDDEIYGEDELGDYQSGYDDEDLHEYDPSLVIIDKTRTIVKPDVGSSSIGDTHDEDEDFRVVFPD